MKQLLYHLKEGIKALYTYPKYCLEYTTSGDYDTYWEEKRGKNIGTLSHWQIQRMEFIHQILKEHERKNIHIADIGCGDGGIMHALKEKNPEIVSCTGYDSSSFALARAETFGIEGHLVDIADPDTLSTCVPADYYLMLEILEHVPHSERMLLTVRSKARNGVFFSFPNSGYIRHRLRFLCGRFPVQWRILPNEHVRFWTLADVRWWLQALDITQYTLQVYEGVPVLRTIFPGLFGAGIIVYVPSNDIDS